MKKIISIPPNYFYLLIILAIPFRFFFKDLNLIQFPWNILGIILMIIGIIFVIIPYNLFVKYKTPEKFQPSTCVVTDGIYKYSRNPMYLGGLIFLIGLVIILQNVLAFIAPIVFFLIINYMFIPYEEEKMETECGQDYLLYKKKVSRWL